MNLDTLKQKLGIDASNNINGNLTIASGDFTSTVDTLIEYCYDNLSFTINAPKISQIDEEQHKIIIKGTSDFLNVSKLPVEATFYIDDDKNVQIKNSYQVLGATPGLNNWKFANSFPNIPLQPDPSQGYNFNRATQKLEAVWINPFDDLNFYNSYFVVCSEAQKDEEENELKKGINFISKLKPSGLLGLVENIFQYKNELSVQGTIALARKNDSPQQLITQYGNSQKKFQYPWTIQEDFEYGVPGILLEIKLDLHHSFIKNKLQFEADSIFLYSPTDLTWNLPDTNPCFVSEFGITGAITMPESDLAINMLIPVEYGASKINIISQFEGFSLNHISELTGLAGSNPFSHLPKQIQDIEHELGKLSLTYASLTIDFSQLSNIHISNASFTIGIPNAKWEIWKNHFEIESLLAEFSYDYPFSSTTVKDNAQEYFGAQNKITVYGTMDIENVPFSVYASNQDNYAAFFEMNSKAQLPLNAIFSKYLPTITPPSDLTIDIFRGGIQAGKEYSFAMEMAGGDNPWKIPIGGAEFALHDVGMNFTYNKTEGSSGSVFGELMFGDIAKLYVEYDSPGDITMRSWVQQVKLSKLINTLNIPLPAFPKNFDLTLNNNSLLIKKQENAFDLELATELEGFGTLMFQAQEQGGQFGTAVGINMTKSTPFNLPGLSSLKAFENILTLNNFLLIVSSFENPNFQFSEAANFQNPALSSNGITLPKGKQGIVKGLNIHATWTLNTEDKSQKLLKNLLGLDPSLDITLQISEIPIENSKLYLEYVTTILDHHKLDCQFGFWMQGGIPEIFLLGKLDTNIHKQKCVFDIGLAILANGFMFSGSMEGTVKVDSLQLSKVGLALGMDWELIPSFGFTAEIDTPNFDSSVAIMLDSTDPAKSLLAGAISDVTLTDIIELFVDGNGDDKLENSHTEEIPSSIKDVLDTISLKGLGAFTMPISTLEALNQADTTQIASDFATHGKITLPTATDLLFVVVNEEGKRWSITDKSQNMRHYQLVNKKGKIHVSQEAQIYLSPEGAQLGAIVFPQGYFVSGALSILGLTWTTQIEVRQYKGIAATSSLNKKLVIYKPQLFNLSDVSGKTGPYFSMSTFAQPNAEQEEYKEPHFCLSGHLHFLGTTTEAYVKATTNGFAFDFNNQSKLSFPGKILSGSIESEFDVHGTFDSIHNFDAGAEANLAIKGKIDLSHLDLFPGVQVNLGKYEMDLDVGGSFDVGYNGKEAFVKLTGHFDFNGSTHHFSKELDASNAQLKHIADVVLDELKDIFKEMFDLAEHFADAVKEGLVVLEKGAEQLAHVFKDGFKIADKEAMKLAHEIGHDFDEIGNAFKNIYGTTEKELSEFMNGVGAEAEQIAGALKNTFKAGAKDVANVLNEIENISPQDVAGAMKGAFNQTAKETAIILKDLKHGEEAIAGALKNTFKQSAKQTVATFKQIGSSIEGVGKALKNVFKLSPNDATKTLKNAGHTAEEIGKALKGGFNKTAKQAAQVLKSVGINTTEIGKTLKNVFKQSDKAMSSTLKSVGKGAKEIGGVLKSVYKKSSKDCAKVLGSIKVGMKDIGHVFKDIYKHDAKTAAKVFKSLKKDSNAIANALKSPFKQNAKNMAKVLSDVGFDANDIGKTMQGVFKLNANDAAKTLKDIGKSSEEVAKVMKGVFKLSANDTGKLLKSTFNLGKDSLKTVMKGVGYASKDIDKFVGSAFKSVGKTLKKIFHF